MTELPSAIPDAEVLIGLAPEELGAKMLFLLRKRRESTFHLGNLHNELWGPFSQLQYPRQHQPQIDMAISEAWAWLQAQGLIVPTESGGAVGLARVFGPFRRFNLAHL